MPACPRLAKCCNSKDINVHICLAGILCGTLAGKKKKKMMYLTAKNAGQNILHGLDVWLMSSLSFSTSG